MAERSGTTGTDKSIGRYVSRLAASWRPDEPRHRQLDGTLVSADLSGFTALTERYAAKGRRGAEELTITINKCFTQLIDACWDEGGDVLKFGGDALLLWFDGKGHAEAGVRSACRMQRRMRTSAMRRAGLRMSVGVHSGATDVFLVGQAHLELIVCGPAATHVVELEAGADAGQILAGATTIASIPESWSDVRSDRGTSVAQNRVAVPRGNTRPIEPPAGGNLERLLPVGMGDHLAALALAGGEHRMATVAFMHIEGLDDRLLENGPAAVARELHETVSAVQTEAEQYGATFQYSDVAAGGVKLLLTAGAPSTTGDDEAALLQLVTEVIRRSDGARLRAGVHRGRVFAGFVGSRERRTYTVMGDPVNLAARLMARAEPGQVLATTAVSSRSSVPFSSSPLQPFLVRGRSEPVTAVIVGHRDTSRRARPQRRHLLHIGREVEQAELSRAVDDAAGGTGRVVEIVGDAGIGKTRLLATLEQDRRLPTRIEVECQPYDALNPYTGLRPLVRQALGIPETASSRQAGTSLLASLRRLAPELEELAPLIAVPVGAHVPTTSSADAVAEEFRTRRIHEATIAALVAALGSPTLLVVEDVYFMDDASLQLLRALAHEVPTRPWLLCVTRRPDGPGVVVGATDGMLIKLAPLGAAQARDLAEAALDRTAIDIATLQALTERSGGNPLFVIELVNATRAGTANDELPESIERLVTTRIDRLAPEQRMTLRQAAVIGRTFTQRLLDELRRAQGEEPSRIDDLRAVDDMIEHVEGDTFRFRHVLFRDAAYEGLPFARRRELHRRAGSLLEDGLDGDAPVSLLSLHFWMGGDMAKAWTYSVAAGEEAWHSYAIVEATACYRRALDARRHVRTIDSAEVAAVAESLGDALERAARYDEAAEAYALARRGPTQPTHQRGRLMRKVGELSERRGRYSQALRWYGRAMRLVESSVDRHDVAVLADLELAYAGVMFRQGRHRKLSEYAGRALATATRANHRRAQARALMLTQLAVSHDGSGGTAPGEQALTIFGELGDVHQQGKVLNNLGIEHYYRGRWSDAAHCYQRAVECFQQAGDSIEAATALNNLAEVYADQAKLEEARELFEQARRIYSGGGFPLGVAVATANLGRIAARRGEPDAALDLLDDAFDLFDTLGSTANAAEIAMRKAEALVLAGRSEAALGQLAEAERLAAATEPLPSTLIGLHRTRGWARFQQGDHAGSAQSFHAAVAVADRDDTDWERALALFGLWQLATVTGDPHGPAFEAEARRTFERAGIDGLPPIPLKE